MANISFQSGTMSRRFQFVLLGCVLALFAAGAWFTYNALHNTSQNANALYNSATGSLQPSSITTFAQCAAAGNPIQQTAPQVCTTKSGLRFVDQ